jgi:uncharacterized membrane protein YccC
MQILLQLGLLLPDTSHIIGERLVDTVIGVAIATVFSFVLPNWEYRSLPRLVRGVLKASRAYIESGHELLQTRQESDFLYRLRRKQFMDSLAALSAALLRMQDEPVSKRRAAAEISQFILQNYLVGAQMAAIRLLLRNHTEKMPRELVTAWLEQSFGQTRRMLEQAGHAFDKGAEAQAEPAPLTKPEARTVDWSGWLPLLRRTRLLQSDARQLVRQAGAIGQALRQGAA